MSVLRYHIPSAHWPHVAIMAITLDSAKREYFHHHRKCYRTALLYTYLYEESFSLFYSIIKESNPMWTDGDDSRTAM